jgi:MFS family permease
MSVASSARDRTWLPAEAGTDRVLVETRVLAIVVIPVLVGAAFGLLVFPGETDRFWAWPIAAHMSAFALGVPYAAGIYFFTRVVFERRWHRVSIGLLPIGAFVTVEAIATLLHWDRFTHDHPVFWAWVALYATTPILLPLFWWRSRATERHQPEPDDVVFPMPARLGFLVAGVGQVAIALFLLLFPAKAIEIWPWPLTPLTARSTAGWFAFGLVGLLLARVTRWSSARIVVQAMLLGFALAPLSIVRAWEEFDTSRAFTWIFIAFLASVSTLMALVYVAMERRRRSR